MTILDLGPRKPRRATLHWTVHHRSRPTSRRRSS
jgi:hypothetical protein